MKTWGNAIVLLGVSAACAGDVPAQFEQARALEQKGALAEAGRLYRSLLPGLRAAHDDRNLAAALDALSVIGSAEGDYTGAVASARDAAGAFRHIHDSAGEAHAVNSAGVASLYLGDYDAALESFTQALALARRNGDTEHEALRLDNVGNVHYYQGRYLEALRAYQQALEIARVHAAEAWSAHAREVTLTNLATLYEKLGQHERALDLYLELRRPRRALSPSEEARYLTNLGTVYRRLGDAVKALETYHAAQNLVTREQRHDIQIVLLKNIGIAQALDFHDRHAAGTAFSRALELARTSSNRLEENQAHLYLAELHYRAGDLAASRGEFQAALAGAGALSDTEQQWKALYGLGRVAARTGETVAARARFEQAIAVIESLRSRLRVSSLKPEFLADKREVYDALAALLLEQTPPSAAAIFDVLERARARALAEQVRTQLEQRLATARPREVAALRDLRARIARLWSQQLRAGEAESARLKSEAVQLENDYAALERRLEEFTPAADPRPPSLAAVRARLDPATALLVFWQGPRQGAVLWVTHNGAAIRRTRVGPEDATRFLAAVSRPGGDSSEAAARLAEALFTGVQPLADPAVRHLLIIRDGLLELLPVEALGAPPLIERFDISYLPSASWLRSDPASHSGWAPWRRELFAIGDPVTTALAPGDETWARLPQSLREVHSISRLLSGRAELHTGADARKSLLLNGRARGVPLLHLSTHAAIDLDNPDRSRIVFSPERGETGFDYLFQRGIQSLDLRGTDLVSLSACETAVGRAVRGEGVMSFSRAFLAAGASTTLTTLWKVADAPAAQLIEQFYYGLGRGMSKAEALRQAKLAFLHSGSELAQPYYWAAFVLTGDGRSPVPQPVSWSLAAAATALPLLICGVYLLHRRR